MGEGGVLSIWLECVLDSLGTVHLLGVGFLCWLGINCSLDVIIVFFFYLEDRGCIFWYVGA